ncbi:Nif3-like dinuclear metal center hexameric protein [Paenibacillus sp. LHD-38]|uniref:Nif3-like dinuclear metal center hexameric protein n=1 Tax=Paenibacillus sp. LHD-38 TaxID=3072143 RepID=UPI0028101535|nr:Nif3-like dinuclear metal center hexameric protein [Paenibacillus sp. LHD-38]MDQ8735861.1 Nif3-like dinuclear metal center hexameric protein [Paenibacillus sp. LHD-38]
MITIQDIIDRLTASVEPIPNTVDTLTFGAPETEITGIAVTFMATQQVLEQSFQLGANLVITHEGTFYSHHDGTQALYADDVVYEAKKWYIEGTGLAVYRFHDYWHRFQPDGIMEGLIHALGWQEHVTENLPAATLVTIPSMKLEQIIDVIKKRLGIHFMRAVGDRSTECTRIGLLAGYRGAGHNAIPLFSKYNLDLIIYGEGPEWETPEYVRDAMHAGKNNALIVLGHLESEQPGMQLLADRLRKWYPGIPVHYMPVDPVFRIV